MSNVSWDIAIGVAFVVGLLLFGISSSMLRSARVQASAAPVAPPEPAPPPPTWPQLIDEALPEIDRDLRLDMIERLGIVRSEWSRFVLQRAQSEERDPALLAAIEAGLHG